MDIITDEGANSGTNGGATALTVHSSTSSSSGTMLVHETFDNLFDFEGSMIDGVASFYKSFGASEERYPVLRYWDSLLKF